MDSKICFVTNFWLGERRFEYSKYQEDNLYFLKQQISCLQTYKHNLTKIIFNFNVTPEHYPYISKIFSITPKQIQGAEVEIIIRENVGISYGAWSDAFSKYKSEYDYYVFNEDDYFFVQHNWDEYLVNKHNSYDDCGYLCMFVREPHIWNSFRKIAGSSVGIATSENLMKIYSKYGKLPSLGTRVNNSIDEYKKGHNIQNQFGFAFMELGLNLYDVRDDYAILFQKPAPINPEIQSWRIFGWNNHYLQVCPFYFEGNFQFYESWDLEWKQEYKTTNYKEAMYLHNNKLTYYEDDYEGFDKQNPVWRRRPYPFDS